MTDALFEKFELPQRGFQTKRKMAADKLQEPAREALKLALEALEEIAFAGMSGTGQESDEAMAERRARQAWKFIGIAARQLAAIKEALAQPPLPEQEAVAVHQFRLMYSADWYDGHPDPKDGHGPYETRTLYTTPPLLVQPETGAVDFGSIFEGTGVKQ